jgi:signal transduction histidine kinase
VWLRDEATSVIRFELAFEDDRIIRKTDPRFSGMDTRLPEEEEWPWPEVFTTGKPSLIEDIRTVMPFALRDRLLPMGIITVLLVPMAVAGRLEGVIGLRFTKKRRFRTEEMELAQALATQAMLALQLTRLSVQSRTSAVLAERNRFARDIHDTLAQGFTGVILQLEAAEEAAARDLASRAAEHIARAAALARECLQEARRSVSALRPQALENNEWSAALNELIRNMTEGTSLAAEFISSGVKHAIPAEWEENLLRIGQEVLTNTIRHASASQFKVQLVFDADEVKLDLRDNGRGFDPTLVTDGFGLLGMRERVESMGGDFRIRSEHGAGTAIAIVLPIANALTAGLQ